MNHLFKIGDRSDFYGIPDETSELAVEKIFERCQSLYQGLTSLYAPNEKGEVDLDRALIALLGANFTDDEKICIYYLQYKIKERQLVYEITKRSNPEAAKEIGQEWLQYLLVQDRLERIDEPPSLYRSFSLQQLITQTREAGIEDSLPGWSIEKGEGTFFRSIYDDNWDERIERAWNAWWFHQNAREADRRTRESFTNSEAICRSMVDVFYAFGSTDDWKKITEVMIKAYQVNELELEAAIGAAGGFEGCPLSNDPIEEATTSEDLIERRVEELVSSPEFSEFLVQSCTQKMQAEAQELEKKEDELFSNTVKDYQLTQLLGPNRNSEEDLEEVEQYLRNNFQAVWLENKEGTLIPYLIPQKRDAISQSNARGRLNYDGYISDGDDGREIRATQKDVLLPAYTSELLNWWVQTKGKSPIELRRHEKPVYRAVHNTDGTGDLIEFAFITKYAVQGLFSNITFKNGVRAGAIQLGKNSARRAALGVAAGVLIKTSRETAAFLDGDPYDFSFGGYVEYGATGAVVAPFIPLLGKGFVALVTAKVGRDALGHNVFEKPAQSIERSAELLLLANCLRNSPRFRSAQAKENGGDDGGISVKPAPSGRPSSPSIVNPSGVGNQHAGSFPQVGTGKVKSPFVSQKVPMTVGQPGARFRPRPHASGAQPKVETPPQTDYGSPYVYPQPHPVQYPTPLPNINANPWRSVPNVPARVSSPFIKSTPRYNPKPPVRNRTEVQSPQDDLPPEFVGPLVPENEDTDTVIIFGEENSAPTTVPGNPERPIIEVPNPHEARESGGLIEFLEPIVLDRLPPRQFESLLEKLLDALRRRNVRRYQQLLERLLGYPLSVSQLNKLFEKVSLIFREVLGSDYDDEYLEFVSMFLDYYEELIGPNSEHGGNPERVVENEIADLEGSIGLLKKLLNENNLSEFDREVAKILRLQMSQVQRQYVTFEIEIMVMEYVRRNPEFSSAEDFLAKYIPFLDPNYREPMTLYTKLLTRIGLSPMAKRALEKAGYEIVRDYAGSGGLGTVAVVIDKRTGKKKIVKEANGQRGLIFLRNEALMLSLVSGDADFVVDFKVLPVGNPKDNAFVLIEDYIDDEEEGMLFVGDLNLFRRTHGISQEVHWKVIDRLSSAIAILHKRYSLIHHDIKPANVMVQITEEGTVKLYVIDFGLSTLEGQFQLNRAGEIYGTESFQDPERLHGPFPLSKPVDDVFGLTHTLWRLIRNPVDSDFTELANVILSTTRYKDMAQLNKFKELLKDVDLNRLKDGGMDPQKEKALLQAWLNLLLSEEYNGGNNYKKAAWALLADGDRFVTEKLLKKIKDYDLLDANQWENLVKGLEALESTKSSWWGEVPTREGFRVFRKNSKAFENIYNAIIDLEIVPPDRLERRATSDSAPDTQANPRREIETDESTSPERPAARNSRGSLNRGSDGSVPEDIPTAPEGLPRSRE